MICAITARLGVWQLDRLTQRRATSAQLASRAAALPLLLAGSGGSDPAIVQALAAGEARRDLEFRRVAVYGTFDYTGELALTNRVWNRALGLHLITPLRLSGSEQAILVDRGWIPAADASPATWGRYRAGGPADPAAAVEVDGWLRLSRRGSVFDTPRTGDRLIENVDVQRIQPLVTSPLLLFYVVQAPSAGGQDAPPYRQPPLTDLGDGVHLIVAVQWFAFSVIGIVGYALYLRKHARPLAELRQPRQAGHGAVPGQRA